MNWLTIDLIKQQLRLDDSQAAMERNLLLMYGESAEAALLQLLRRTADNVVETFGDVPMPLIHAALMLVDIAYQYRSPISPASVNQVGYTFEILVKPYMRLAGDDDNGGGGDLPEGALMDCNGVVLMDNTGVVLCGA